MGGKQLVKPWTFQKFDDSATFLAIVHRLDYRLYIVLLLLINIPLYTAIDLFPFDSNKFRYAARKIMEDYYHR